MSSGLIPRYKDTLEAGTDEAGRGCLAGPVTAACIMLPENFEDPVLNDSKQLSEKQRDRLRPILEKSALGFGICHVFEDEIDQINILNASIMAMHRALDQLATKPKLILVDGNRFKPYKDIPHECIVKGDSKFLSIAGASILAKTHRDAYMLKIHEEFPMYNWARNKGYPTKEHRAAIKKYGLTKYHRKSFRQLPQQLAFELQTKAVTLVKIPHMKFRKFLVFLVIISCAKEKNNTKSLLNYFPSDAAVVVKVNHLDKFKSELKNNSFLTKIKTSALFSSLRKKTETLNLLSPLSECTIAFYEVGKNNYDFLLLNGLDSNLLALGKTADKKFESLVYDNHSINKYEVNKNVFYSTSIGGRTVVGSSQMLLENAIRLKGKNEVPQMLEKLYNSSDASKSATLFLNLKESSLVESQLQSENEANIGVFGDWITLDFSVSQKDFLLGGVVMANDSTKNFISLFKDNNPLPDRTAAIAPQNSDAVLIFSFNDFETLQNHQKTYLDLAHSNSEMVKDIEEIGIVFMNGEKAVVLHSLNAEGLSQTLENIKFSPTNYQGGEIWRLENAKFITELFAPLVKNFESNFYTVSDDAHIFASKEATLQTLIANQKNGNTFNKTDYYTTVKSKMADESTLLFVAGQKGLDHFFGKHFSFDVARDFKGYDLKNMAFGAQLISDSNFSHFNILAAEIQQSPSNNSVAPLFTLELDSDLVIDPQFVKNHRNNNWEIVVQDQDNNLYLISTEGKVLWKKQLDGKIRGKIHQVDLYKNGRLQMAFCTNNQFLVLDRNGEITKDIDKTYEGGNLNGLAVFDYENNRNYRMVVTQGRKVFMYNNDGNLVEGFTYKEAESPIILPPKHFRMGKKDYLVFQLENGRLKILHRAGGERIKVARTIDFSNNEVFLYNNKFSLTDKKGILHQVDSKGKLSASNFNLEQDHGIFATSKTLALMDENVLSIKGKKVELELGVYTKPKIFYINDKIYVAVTDIQSQKVHLYDSQARPIPNFPVYGSSIVDMVDMDGDRKLELVAKDQDNSIIIYTIN